MKVSFINLARAFWKVRQRALSSVTLCLESIQQNYKHFDHDDIFKIFRNSMKASYKEISVIEPVPYPTLEELPSQHCILTLKQMDDKLNNLTLDIYAMYSVTQEIKNSIMHLNCSLDYFQRCGMRLMGLINCIFQHYGIDRYHFAKLMTCLRYCNTQWKRNLIKTIGLLNSYPSTHSIFLYKMNRNIYLWMMLRTNNTILSKMLNRLVVNKRLNAKSLKYLEHHSVFTYYDNTYTKIVEILQEKEEETHLKILLVNQFIKYTLFYLNFCYKNKTRMDLFNKFFNIVQYTCRIMKKFHSPTTVQPIKECLNIIRQSLVYYIDILQRNPLNQIKIEQVKHIIRIIMQVPFKQAPPPNVSQNACIIKLIIKILTNWKKLHSRAQRIKSSTITRSTQELSINQFAKKEKENHLRSKIENGKIDQIKIEFMKLNKSRSNLCRRKSQSMKNLGPFIENAATGQITINPSNNIKIRKEIEGNMSKYFYKSQALKMPKSFSKDRKKQLSLKKQDRERELKIEDYSQHMQSRLKIVPNLNKIQLYRPQKMRQFCKKQLKLKLQSSPNAL